MIFLLTSKICDFWLIIRQRKFICKLYFLIEESIITDSIAWLRTNIAINIVADLKYISFQDEVKYLKMFKLGSQLIINFFSKFLSFQNLNFVDIKVDFSTSLALTGFMKRLLPHENQEKNKVKVELYLIKKKTITGKLQQLAEQTFKVFPDFMKFFSNTLSRAGSSSSRTSSNSNGRPNDNESSRWLRKYL